MVDYRILIGVWAGWVAHLALSILVKPEGNLLVYGLLIVLAMLFALALTWVLVAIAEILKGERKDGT